jgi:drug/metabolite transporter (DMT)-like permease
VKNKQLFKGAFYCVLGYFFIAIMSACAKEASQHVPLITLLFFQNAIPFVLSIPQFIRLGKGNYLPQQWQRHLIRDVFGVLTFFCLFFAIKFIPLVDGVLLQNSAPLWVPLIVVLWAKKKLPKSVWIGSIVGFIGVILVLKPGAEVLNWAVVIGIASGLSLGIALVAIKLLSHTEPTVRILFYYFLFGTIISLPYTVYHWAPMNEKVWLLLIVIGVLMFLAQFLVTHAFRYAKASTLAPISYTAVLWAGVIGWLVWNYIPNWVSLLGMVLIISGGMFAIMMENRNPT